MELSEWKIDRRQPTGDITSLTDGKLELVTSSKLGRQSHPRVVMPGKSFYDCNHPVSMRREGAKTIFHYAFSERHTFTLDYEVEWVVLPDRTAALRQNVKISAPEKITDTVMLVLPRNIQLPE